MTVEIDIAAIDARNQKLEHAAASLRAKFVGIDAVINDLVDAMRVWYLMPEVLVRPVIINLWGMTGVGKTDMVRQLVKALDLQDRFAEVEMSNGDQTQYYSSVASVLESNSLNDEKPKILLFDEMQRFNTIDNEGKQLPVTKFADFWELLSDGRLAKRQRDNLDDIMFNYQAQMRDNRRRRAAGEEVEIDQEIGLWDGRNLKQRLGFVDDIDDLASLKQSSIIERIRKVKDKKVIYEPVDHSKSLIIISGNLDEAFSMARAIGEADVDADIFHAFTKKITIVDIKSALGRRFKPEQVARFGNIHLIYRSLTKHDFQAIIGKEIARVVSATKSRFGIALTVGAGMPELIYRNGVFPVQGVRPVFSSVIDILETNLSKLLFKAITGKQKSISIDYAPGPHKLIAEVGGTKSEIPFTGRLDRVRERNLDDVVANISVHESGHAVAYIVLLGLAPLQLTCKVTSSYAAGFTFPHEVHLTREAMLQKIKVYLAGGLAEEAVFGPANASIGRGDDRESATQLVLDYIRRYGFDPRFQAAYTMDGAYMLDRTITDLDAEKLIGRLVAETEALIQTHKPLVVELATRLRAAGELTTHAIAECAREYGLAAEVATEGHLHLPGYAGLLEGVAGKQSAAEPRPPKKLAGVKKKG